MANYNPDSYDHGCPDVTILTEVYTVTAFSEDDPAVEVDFQTGSGAHKATALERGKRTATMTIEVGTQTNIPAQFATFDYEGSAWVIKNVTINKAASSPTTYNLALNRTGAAA